MQSGIGKGMQKLATIFMKRLVLVISIVVILKPVLGQTNYCDDSIKKEDLIGKTVKIYSFDPISNYLFELDKLFDSTITNMVVKNDRKLPFENFDGKNAKVFDISRDKSKFYNEKVYILKINNLYVPLTCSSLADTNCLSGNECCRKYDSIFKPTEKSCFPKLDINYDWVSFKFHDFVCTLQENGIDTIIAINQWGGGDFYANISCFAIWAKNNQWYIKGYSLAHHSCGYYDSRNHLPINETDTIEFGDKNLLQWFSIERVDSYRKDKEYKNSTTNLYMVDIWQNFQNKTQRVSGLYASFLIKKSNEEPNNEFLKLLKYILEFYSTSTY